MGWRAVSASQGGLSPSRSSSLPSSPLFLLRPTLLIFPLSPFFLSADCLSKESGRSVPSSEGLGTE